MVLPIIFINFFYVIIRRRVHLKLHLKIIVISPEEHVERNAFLPVHHLHYNFTPFKLIIQAWIRYKLPELQNLIVIHRIGRIRSILTIFREYHLHQTDR